MDQPMKHKLNEAVTNLEPDVAPDGNAPTAQAQGKPPREQGKGPSHEEIAEETRREQQARPSGRPDREDYLVNVGRGQQTHG